MKYRRLFFVVIIIIICTCARADIPVRAKFLAADNGLGTNYARTIVQDSRGYIWISSTNGLVRYDGYKAYVLTPSDAPNRKLMLDFRIQDMRLLDDRFLLLRLRGRKYSCYDILTDQFIEFSGNYDEIFNTRQVSDRWPADSTLLHKKMGAWPARCDAKKDNRGNTVLTTTSGDIWHVDGKTKEVTHIAGVYSEALLRLNGKPRYGIITDKDGLIWVSTYGNGLFVHDRKTGETTHFLKSNGNIAPIETNYLLGIYEDKAGNIWACQENMGVAIISKQDTSTETLYFTTPDDMGHTNSIHLLNRQNGVIYIGNQYNGLKVADGLLKTTHTASRYNDDVVVVSTGKDGTLWMGTRKSGVYVNDKQYQNAADDPASLSAGKISDILCDSKGRIWVSIFDGAVDMAEPDGNGGYRFRHFFTGSDAIEQPRQMLADYRGYIWLSSNDGLFVFHPDKLTVDNKAYQHIYLNEKLPQLDEIHCIFETRRHTILAGTQGSGMAELDNSTPGEPRLMHIFTTQDGMPDNNIQQLTEDRDGNVWIGTDHGLARYNPKDKSILSLLPADTQQGNMFVENAVCKLDDGRLAFGSRHGVIIIDPHHLPLQQSPFKLRITGMDVNGIPVHEQEDGTMSTLLENLETIELGYNQNSLTFYFSDFEYAEGYDTKYSYRLIGYDKEWSSQSEINFATYKNLSPGSYTLEVRALGANGQLDDITVRLPVIVDSPWWATWWAKLLYLLVVGAAATGIWHYFKHTNDLRNRIKVETQLTEYKLRFFTNISHEFRTPLTIIRGAMERITAIGDIPGDMRQPVSTMQKSVDRMMRLINQLLEFRKMQNDKLQLALEETDVIAFIKEIYLTFYQTAENKRISYNFLPFAHKYMMFVDKSFVDKIVYNLLSNAFKYTMSRHSIDLRISLDEEAHMIVIKVEDTGIGIPKEKQADLFSRYNQSVYTQDSIGIGLNLVHELVNVHHGTIAFTENPAGGAIFTVTLPTDKSCYAESDFLVADNDLLREQNVKEPETLTDYQELAAEPFNDRLILIVEDDDGIRKYLEDELRKFFVIVTTSNGQEALERLQTEKPDLIISDVMMPIMNGYELTKIIRSDSKTSDIPIILLTAMIGEEKKVKGFDVGADAYIEKPFSLRILVAKCRQLISQRDQLRLQYAKEVVGKAALPEIIVEEQDQRLRNLFDSWLSAHFSDPNLDINKFAESMGYGRTTFFKKVKKLTGQTPNDYIKSMRMKHAAELLKDDTLTVAQVSYQIGIDDPYYFSKSFKSYFGVSPTQFRKGEKAS